MEKLQHRWTQLVDQKTFKVDQKMSIDDWRYSDQKMKVREQALKILLAKFGDKWTGSEPKYSSKAIYECANDWVSQGNYAYSRHSLNIVRHTT